MRPWIILIVLAIYISSACAYTERVSLQSSRDAAGIQQLQTLLDQYRYSKNYEVDVFDCADMTVACTIFLENLGYDVTIMASKAGNEYYTHCYPAVYVKNGWVAVETTDSIKSLGKIHRFGKSKYDYLYGASLDNVTELYKTDTGRRGIIINESNINEIIIKN